MLAAHGLHRPGAKLGSMLVTFGSVKAHGLEIAIEHLHTVLREIGPYSTLCPWLFLAMASPV